MTPGLAALLRGSGDCIPDGSTVAPSTSLGVRWANTAPLESKRSSRECRAGACPGLRPTQGSALHFMSYRALQAQGFQMPQIPSQGERRPCYTVSVGALAALKGASNRMKRIRTIL